MRWTPPFALLIGRLLLTWPGPLSVPPTPSERGTEEWQHCCSCSEVVDSVVLAIPAVPWITALHEIILAVQGRSNHQQLVQLPVQLPIQFLMPLDDPVGAAASVTSDVCASSTITNAISIGAPTLPILTSAMLCWSHNCAGYLQICEGSIGL